MPHSCNDPLTPLTSAAEYDTAPSVDARSRANSSALWLLLAGLLFVASVVRAAWIGDDAFITLRSVFNLHEGYGPVYNVAERVQVYTHPLWMLVLSAVTGITREYYYSVLALQGAIALVTLMLVCRVAPRPTRAWLVLALALSMSFVDYSTSGLENGLAHLLFAAFLGLGLCERVPARGFALIAGLIVLNRMDHAVLVGPFLLWRLWPLGWRPCLSALAFGFAPFVLWELWAIFYYGSPFPITAQAKAFSTGIPQSELIEQGKHYFVDVLRRDPWTAILVVLGVVVGLTRCRTWPLSLSVILYGAYILRVGGDFMSTRFFSVPLLIGLLLIARRLGGRGGTSVERDGHAPSEANADLAMAGATQGAGRVQPLGRARRIALTAVFVVAAIPYAHRQWVGPAADTIEAGTHHSIANERQFYYQRLGLLSEDRLELRPDLMRERHPYVDMDAFTAHGPIVVYLGGAGVSTFVGGPHVHLLDPFLVDPLLARLPKAAGREWRIGHVPRRVPEGYVETISTGKNRLVDEGLREYYEDLLRIQRGDLWSSARLASIWRVLTGARRAGLDRFAQGAYRKPPLLRVDAAGLGPPVAVGSPRRFDLGQRVVYEGGLELQWPRPQRARKLRIGVDHADRYAFEFLRGGKVLGRREAGSTAKFAIHCIVHLDLSVPETVEDFDTIRVSVLESSDDIAVVAFVQVLD